MKGLWRGIPKLDLKSWSGPVHITGLRVYMSMFMTYSLKGLHGVKPGEDEEALWGGLTAKGRTLC